MQKAQHIPILFQTQEIHFLPFHQTQSHSPDLNYISPGHTDSGADILHSPGHTPTNSVCWQSPDSFPIQCSMPRPDPIRRHFSSLLSVAAFSSQYKKCLPL